LSFSARSEDGDLGIASGYEESVQRPAQQTGIFLGVVPPSDRHNAVLTRPIRPSAQIAIIDWIRGDDYLRRQVMSMVIRKEPSQCRLSMRAKHGDPIGMRSARKRWPHLIHSPGDKECEPELGRANLRSPVDVLIHHSRQGGAWMNPDPNLSVAVGNGNYPRASRFQRGNDFGMPEPGNDYGGIQLQLPPKAGVTESVQVSDRVDRWGVVGRGGSRADRHDLVAQPLETADVALVPYGDVGKPAVGWPD
jgi:hypothetical protein